AMRDERLTSRFDVALEIAILLLKVLGTKEETFGPDDLAINRHSRGGRRVASQHHLVGASWTRARSTERVTSSLSGAGTTTRHCELRMSRNAAMTPTNLAVFGTTSSTVRRSAGVSTYSSRPI